MTQQLEPGHETTYDIAHPPSLSDPAEERLAQFLAAQPAPGASQPAYQPPAPVERIPATGVRRVVIELAPDCDDLMPLEVMTCLLRRFTGLTVTSRTAVEEEPPLPGLRRIQLALDSQMAASEEQRAAISQRLAGVFPGVPVSFVATIRTVGT